MMGNFIEWKIESNCNIKTQLLGGSAPYAGLLQYISGRLGGRDGKMVCLCSCKLNGDLALEVLRITEFEGGHGKDRKRGAPNHFTYQIMECAPTYQGTLNLN